MLSRLLCTAFLLLSGAGSLWGEVKPVELPSATTGRLYAYALETNKPAHFVKSGGNADWLRVTPEGVLAGTPSSEAPAVSVIAVEALADGRGSDSVSLHGWFVIRVQTNSCVGGGTEELEWCDGGAAVPQRPAKNKPLAFGPMEQREDADSSIEGEKDCYSLNGCIVQFDRLHEEEIDELYKKIIACLNKVHADRIQRKVALDGLPRKTGELGHYNPATRSFIWKEEQLGSPPGGTLKSDIVRSINGSKVFMSGSVLINTGVDDCEFYSWSVVTQTVDSSNNLFYGPSDLNAFCTGRTVLIVLPVHAIWANVYGVRANTNDPTWKPLPDPPKPHECWTGATEQDSPTQGIRVCDLTDAPPGHQYDDERPNGLLKSVGYSGLAEWLYNRAEQPGVSQGSISIAPVAATTKSTMDVQVYESWQQHEIPGWIGFQGMYEHDRKPADDLNSLTAALTYDYRIFNNRRYWWEWGATRAATSERSEEEGQGFGPDASEGLSPPIAGIRPVEFIVRGGPEWAPDGEVEKAAGKVMPTNPPEPEKGMFTVPRDLNMVMGSALRVPIVLNLERQNYLKLPSQITLAPVEGMEWGTRMAPHPIGGVWEPRVILRQVPGVDASARWPYNFTRNFFGDRPITVDFSYRERLLYYAEPSFNERFVSKHPKLSELPEEEQSTVSRSYMRLTYIAPISAYFQARVTWQHGELPPAFQYVGSIWSIGFTFSNPGSSEH